MGTSGSAPNITREDVRGVFSRLDEPSTPLTAGEVAEELECQGETARDALENPAERGEIAAKRIDGSDRVWWQSGGVVSAGQRSDSTEFNAFVSAVRDYAIFRLDPDGTVASRNEGAERMRATIEGLLEYSRVETRGDPFEPIDPETVLSDVRNDLQLRVEESDAEITTDSLPRVEGDVDQLRRVFQNLLENAIEYSGDTPPRIHVAAERAGDEWLVSVEDEGIGIDPDDADRIFQVFHRLHNQEEHAGTGIGLALRERIVERHGGDIWVDSEPGEDTTFYFTLPAAGESDE